jgi:phosphoserine phosphatase
MREESTAFLFDLDGTITSEEVLPLIGRELGLYDEILKLTNETIQGVIPFETSFRIRCELLKSVPIDKVQEIVSAVSINPDIATFLSANKQNCFIVTGNLDVWIQPLVAKLGVSTYSSIGETNLEDQNMLIGVKEILSKAEAVHDVRKKFNRIVAIGDGMGDVGMFEQADVGIAFGGVHFPVEALLKNASFVTFSGSSLCKLLKQL